jgi:hypothetical protein
LRITQKLQDLIHSFLKTGTCNQENGLCLLRYITFFQIERHVLIDIKGASSVIYHHKYSITKALIELFPDIGLQEEKFLDKRTFSKAILNFFHTYNKMQLLGIWRRIGGSSSKIMPQQMDLTQEIHITGIHNQNKT